MFIFPFKLVIVKAVKTTNMSFDLLISASLRRKAEVAILAVCLTVLKIVKCLTIKNFVQSKLMIPPPSPYGQNLQRS